ncbi:unnamed protein product, partial [marine sediment metagenome]
VDFIHVDDTQSYQTMTRAVDGRMDPSRTVIEKLTVEENGPLHAVILLKGRYQYQTVGSTFPEQVTQRGFCPFTLRLHFYRGSGLVTAEHFFVYEGDPDHDFIRQMSFSLPVALAREGSSVTFGGDRQDHKAEGIAAALYQESCDDYRIMTRAPQQRHFETTAEGTRAPGWMDICSAEAGVTTGIRWFWQQHAKALHADLATGRLAVHLWPPQARPLDYRRYARIRAAGEAGIGSAKGTGKVHEFMLYFH